MLRKTGASIWNYLIVALVIALFYWVMEALIETAFIEGTSFPSNLISLGTHELWMRSFSVAVIFIFALYVLFKEYTDWENRQLFEHLFNQSFDLSFIIDDRSRILRVNEVARKTLGYTEEELKGRPIEELFAKEESAPIATILERSGTMEREFVGETHVLTKSGEAVPVEVGGSSFTANRRSYLLGTFRDLRERKEKERKENELLLSENIFRHTLEGILITDTEGTIEKVNPSFTDITGYREDEVIGENPRILKSDHHDQAFYRKLWRHLIEHGSWEGEIWNRKKSGEAYPEWLSITSLKDSRGKVRNYLSMFHDITEKKHQEKRLEQLAYHDGLTNLPNRKLFMDRFKMAIASASRDKELTALLFIDIDDFKNINDTLGHPAGDNLLVQVKEKILSVCREEDTLARHGGDEFVLLLPSLQNSQSVTAVASRILALFNSPYIIEGYEHFVSVSIGIALSPDDGEDVTTLLKHADLALYNAKGMGKNTFAFFKESLNRRMVRRKLIETELRKAIRETNFLLYFQPKMDIRERRVVSIEALLRWQLSPDEWVSPAEFIPVAEQTDLILPIGSWVMRTAVKFLKELHDGGHRDITMGINVSPKQFLTPGFIEEVQTIIEEHEIAPSSVILEITEHVLMHDVRYSKEILRKLRDLGFHISIDDFGTGYSSLSYLKEFPVSEIKIDRSFIKDLPDSRHASAITRSLIAVASTLDYSIVAEGVESEEHAEFLQRHRCHIGQGYLYSKPIPKEELVEFIQRANVPARSQ